MQKQFTNRLKLLLLTTFLVAQPQMVYGAPSAMTESNSPGASREGERCGETHIDDNDRKNLSQATALVHREKGDSNQPCPAWKSFQKYKKFGAYGKEEIMTLISKGTPAGRLYGVILLKEFDPKAASEILTKMKSDKTAVNYFRGCAAEASTVGELAQRIAKGEELIAGAVPKSK